MTVRTLDDIEIADRRVLIRADLNVPVEDGEVTDTARIEASAETIREVVDAGGTALVITHLGRPAGQRDDAWSLRPVVAPLQEAVNRGDVAFADDCVGPETEAFVGDLEAGRVALLENLRFHPGEKDNDPDFAARLAALADCYVNDAFSVSHRAHASVAGVARHLPSAAGRLMQRELESLGRRLGEPKRPYLAILGGAKVKTKLETAEALLEKGTTVILAGVMANTVLHAQGKAIGRSRIDTDMTDIAERLLSRAASADGELVLPADAAVAKDPESQDDGRSVPISDMTDDEMILDAGPRFLEEISSRLKDAGTVLWNGPLGAVENPAFARSTLALARLIAKQTESGSLISVVGGGDTLAVLRREKSIDRFSYVSMAGGALLAWVRDAELPGVRVLEQ